MGGTAHLLSPMQLLSSCPVAALSGSVQMTCLGLKERDFQDVYLCIALTPPRTVTLSKAKLNPLPTGALRRVPVLGFCSGCLFSWSPQDFDLEPSKALGISKV